MSSLHLYLSFISFMFVCHLSINESSLQWSSAARVLLVWMTKSKAYLNSYHIITFELITSYAKA